MRRSSIRDERDKSKSALLFSSFSRTKRTQKKERGETQTNRVSLSRLLHVVWNCSPDLTRNFVRCEENQSSLLRIQPELDETLGFRVGALSVGDGGDGTGTPEKSTEEGEMFDRVLSERSSDFVLLEVVAGEGFLDVGPGSEISEKSSDVWFRFRAQEREIE